jgi:hypothetical protein
MPNEWGYLAVSDDGKTVQDPEGRVFATIADNRIMWVDSRGGKVQMPLEHIRSVRKAEEPDGAIVTLADGTEQTCYGCFERVQINEPPPERTGGKITDLEHILDYVCGPRLDSSIWTDYHDGAQLIDMAIIGEDRRECAIDDAYIPIRRFVEAQSMIIWGRPLNVTERDMVAFLKFKAAANTRNRFIEQIRAGSKQDIEHPRSTGAYDVFQSAGLTAPAPGITSEEEERYVRWVNRAVLLATIERQFHPAIVDICPVLIGPQGTGKTAMCRFLGGKWYKASTQDVRNTRQFMESVSGAVIAEFREGIQTLNPETLKDFLDSDKVQYRKAYGKKEEEYAVPFATVITTNDPQPLLDLTGARRMLPLYMEPQARIEKPWELTEEDMAAMWGRALRDYERGERWRDGWDEVKDTAAKMQEYASRAPPFYDQVIEVLEEWPKIGDKIPRPVLIERLEDRIGQGNTKLALEGIRKNPARFGIELRNKPQKFDESWRPSGTGKSCRFYQRIEER